MSSNGLTGGNNGGGSGGYIKKSVKEGFTEAALASYSIETFGRVPSYNESHLVDGPTGRGLTRLAALAYLKIVEDQNVFFLDKKIQQHTSRSG